MQKLLFIAFLLFGLNTFCQEEAEAISLDFIGNLKSQKYATAHTFLNEEIKSQLVVESLEGIWEQTLEKFGKFKSFESNCVENTEAGIVTYTTCYFKNATYDIKIILDANNLIASFTLNEVYNCNQEPYQAPAYDQPELYSETEVSFKTGDITFPASLVLPKNTEKNTILIFVHGSGPNDRDESYGPNKMFRDLAVGLAGEGYASLRYEKRTKIYTPKSQAEITNFTIQDEVLDDVQSAIQFLQNNESTKEMNIVLLGHSLGAMMIPKSAVDNEAVKGMILMAGPANPFEDLLPYQYEYLFGLDGKISKEEKEQIEQIKGQVQVVKKNLTETTPATDLPLGLNAKYWLSLKDHHQTALAKEFKGPVLVMNGERDYQVPMTEYQKWQADLAGKENVTFKDWAILNHFFFEGEGTPNPDEYKNRSNVPDYVIEFVADWLDNNH